SSWSRRLPGSTVSSRPELGRPLAVMAIGLLLNQSGEQKVSPVTSGVPSEKWSVARTLPLPLPDEVRNDSEESAVGVARVSRPVPAAASSSTALLPVADGSV